MYKVNHNDEMVEISLKKTRNMTAIVDVEPNQKASPYSGIPFG